MLNTRRGFIGALAGGAAAATLSGQARRTAQPAARMSPLDGVTRENIKITGLRLISLGYRLKPEEEWPDGGNGNIIWKTESVIVEVSTDVGLKGIGAASRYNGPAGMKVYLEQVVKPALVGKNPFDVEHLSGNVAAGGPRGVWAGVDVALWDIIGKAKGLPLYKILATDTEPVTRIPAYASAGEFTWLKGSRFPGPEQVLKEVQRFKAAGYRAYKFRMGAAFERFATIKDWIPYLRELRRLAGPDFHLIQESNQRWSLEQCLEIAPVLEEIRALWWEEPMRKNIDNYLALKKVLPTVKISGGETVSTRNELAEWMDSGAYDIIQPGVDDAGLTECWHQARMAHLRGKLICPHNWQDNLVAVANAHLMAAVPNRFYLESNMTPNPLKEGLFKEWWGVKDGYFTVPDKPGLGVELKEGLEEMYPPVPGPWNIPDPDMPPAPPAPKPAASTPGLPWPSRPGQGLR